MPAIHRLWRERRNCLRTNLLVLGLPPIYAWQ
jgi:hypothetical protein